MAIFMTASLVVWLAVMLYVGRLGLRQRRLQQSLEALQDQVLQETDDVESRARAA